MRDNVPRRIEWEHATGGTVTVDKSASPWLWRARDADDAELARANDLSVVMDWLDRHEEAGRRRVAYAVAYPQAKFWTSGGTEGPLQYHGSLPVQGERMESGPHAELGRLMDSMEALASRALALRAAR